jgi:hypothetical protein
VGRALTRKSLEQMLTDVTVHETNPFGDQPKGDPAAEERPVVDVSLAAMSRLRTPFGADGDTYRTGADPADQR